MLEETGLEDAADLGFMLLRALRHLTRERRGWELAKRLLLYDIQGQLVTDRSCARLFRVALVNFEHPVILFRGVEQPQWESTD
jgi:hypothetical protein